MRLFAAVTALLLATSSPAAQLTSADVGAWLDGFVPYAMNTGDIAGGVVVVVKDGEVLAQKGYGYADVAAKKPVDPQRTLFRAGSVAKLVVHTAVMQLRRPSSVSRSVSLCRTDSWMSRSMLRLRRVRGPLFSLTTVRSRRFVTGISRRR